MRGTGGLRSGRPAYDSLDISAGGHSHRSSGQFGGIEAHWVLHHEVSAMSDLLLHPSRAPCMYLLWRSATGCRSWGSAGVGRATTIATEAIIAAQFVALLGSRLVCPSVSPLYNPSTPGSHSPMREGSRSGYVKPNDLT